MAPIDYSLYLVTGRHLLPAGKDYYESLEESLKGGVTVVQVREKTVDTGEFLEIAQKTKNLCHKYHVPVIINDRIDIALAVGADGVHIGQTDMPFSVARRLLPDSMIIGVSVGNVAEAQAASQDGADYVGVGPVWWTDSKQLTKDVIGVRGVAAILDALSPTIKTVGIGGIKGHNLLRTFHGAVSISGRSLDGVAVISEIVSSSNPTQAASNLSKMLRSFTQRPSPTSLLLSPTDVSRDAKSIASDAAELLLRTRSLTPLVHQITNYVAMTQSANITLAMGASPIMATAPEEMADLSKIIGGLLVNFGTIANIQGMILAGQHANQNGKPVVFDPVAVGATNHRRTTANELLNTWQATVIKGNAGEIGALAGLTEVKSRGVDSVGPGFANSAKIVKELALRERCIIVLTGREDYISDGNIVIKLSNGHELLPGITASGCIVGSAIATYCGALNMLEREKDIQASHGSQSTDGRLVKGDMLLGAITGVLVITVASELAAERSDVHGTGTFLPALIDEVGKLTPEILSARAKITILES